MQNIKIEYWELVRQLNLGNKLINEKTEIIFEIQIVEKSKRALFAINKPNHTKLVLCKESKKEKWQIENYKFEKLIELVIENILLGFKHEKNLNISEKVKLLVFK